MNQWHEQLAQEQQGEIWGAAALIVGTGVSMIGANSQGKADAHAQDLNQQAAAETERQNWVKYLQTRGVYAPDAASGTIPGRTAGQAMNTRLPLWMNVTNPTQGVPQGTDRSNETTEQPFLVAKNR